jgi:4-amino-4-deoxy-L-arabinose transferase-like glycosyltransferase
MTASARSPLRLLLLILLIGSVYRALALHWAGLNLYVDEAQYWTWAKSLAWGYYSKPPVIAAIIAGTTALFGDGELAIKSGALLLYPLTTLLVYALALRLYDRRVAFWSALAFFTLPGVAFSSVIISTDVALFTSWTAACYGLLRALENNQWRWWLLVGLAGGVGLLTKYTMGIFAVSTLLYLGLTPTLRAQLRNPRLYLAALLSALIFAPNLWWNHLHGWPTFQHTADISNLEAGPGLHFDELLEFLLGQAAIIGPVLFFALIALIARPGQWLAEPRQRFLACMALPFLLIISLQALLGRANANWAAMTYASGTVWLVAWLLQAERRRLLIVAIALNLALASLAYHYHALTRLAGIELTRKSDHYKRVQGWDSVGAEVRQRLIDNPGAILLTDQRDLMSELRYYARPESDSAVMWNPRHEVVSHYHLVTSMDDKIGADFLYITRDERLPDEVAMRFFETLPLEPIRVPVVPGWSLDFQVFLLRRFQGYEGPLPLDKPPAPPLS